MVPETWHEARLIPTSGIGSPIEQERRATSALLAVIGAVDEFGKALLKTCGAPSGRIETYVEVPFELGKKSLRPDGVIRVVRGKKLWTALVEVKTSVNTLELEQVENYLDLAKENSYDAVITISNEIPPVVGTHPLVLDKRKVKNVPIYHFSWVRIVSTALMQKEVHGVEDPDQAWILGELIRYLEHQNSGALAFTDMGASWTKVREDARKGVLKKSDPDVLDVAAKFDALVRFTCLRLGQKLGTEVFPQLPRRQIQNPKERTAELIDELIADSCLSAKIRIPDTVADLDVRCDLRGQQIHVSVTVPASSHARSETRARWLLRQLSEDLQDVVVEASGRGKKVAVPLSEARSDEKSLAPDPDWEISKFKVTHIYPLGIARSTRAKSSFIDSVSNSVDDFYGRVLQRLKPWNPPAPKLRAQPEERKADDQYSSTDLSSMDTSEPATPPADALTES